MVEEIDWGHQSRTITASLSGSHLAGAVFVFAYLRLQAREGWLLSIVYTALLWGAFYGLFDQMLHLPFPAGWVFGWLGLAD